MKYAKVAGEHCFSLGLSLLLHSELLGLLQLNVFAAGENVGRATLSLSRIEYFSPAHVCFLFSICCGGLVLKDRCVTDGSWDQAL